MTFCVVLKVFTWNYGMINMVAVFQMGGMPLTLVQYDKRQATIFHDIY